jgi:uncharacterized protein (DUF58 family)
LRILTLLFVLCAAVSVVSAQPSASATANAIEAVEAGEDADVELVLPVAVSPAVRLADEVAAARLTSPSPAPIAPPPIPPPEA